MSESDDCWRIVTEDKATRSAEMPPTLPTRARKSASAKPKQLTVREGLNLLADHKRLNREFITVADEMRKLSGALLKNMDNLRDFERRMGKRHEI